MTFNWILVGKVVPRGLQISQPLLWSRTTSNGPQTTVQSGHLLGKSRYLASKTGTSTYVSDYGSIVPTSLYLLQSEFSPSHTLFHNGRRSTTMSLWLVQITVFYVPTVYPALLINQWTWEPIRTRLRSNMTVVLQPRDITYDSKRPVPLSYPSPVILFTPHSLTVRVSDDSRSTPIELSMYQNLDRSYAIKGISLHRTSAPN